MATIVVHDWSEFITAVGTAGADVEFPHSSEYIVRTQDVNVDPNKLYVDANGIVQTNVQPSDLPNLYENTFVLDANHDNTLRLGLTEPISIRCASINGYGGYIKNMASNASRLFSYEITCPITQIAFLNMFTMNYPFFYINGNAETAFTFCLFGGETVASSTQYSLFDRISGRFLFTSCSFAINVKTTNVNVWINVFCTNGHQGDTGCRLTDCRVDMDLSEATNCRMYIVPQNSYFTGDLGSNSIFILGYSGADTCYYSIFEITGSGQLITRNGQSGAVSNITSILVNEDLFSGTIPYGRLELVSSTDLTNAQILRDTYGFLIQT